MLSANNAPSVSLLVPDSHFAKVTALLREAAAGVAFTVHKPAQVFAGENALYRKLETALASV